MSTYEEDHNLPPPTSASSSTSPSSSTTTPSRPHLDLTTFFNTLPNPPTPPATTQHPSPHQQLATFLSTLPLNPLITTLITTLQSTSPPTTSSLPPTYTDTLDRIPKTALKQTDICPICSSPFLADPYPLVVRLPCHPNHLFDLECIQPWLRLNTTCPLDRVDLLNLIEEKKAQIMAENRNEEAEEEWDDQYG